VQKKLTQILGMRQIIKAGEMVGKQEQAGIEKQKIDLIKLRIKNKFYDREDVYEKVILELLNKELKIK
jgi:hypothetical protein